MKQFLNNPLVLLMFIISILLTLNSCNDSDDDFNLSKEQETSKKLTVKKMSYKEIKEITPLYEKVLTLNHNIHGRGDNAIFEVSLGDAYYMSDGVIETYTFPIQTYDSISKYNLMINKVGNEYKPFLIYYELTDEEFLSYKAGDYIDLTDKTTLTALENDEFSILDRGGNPETNGCFQVFKVTVDCSHAQCQADHRRNGYCTHPDEYLEIHQIPCVTNGGGGPSSPGDGGTPASGSNGNSHGGPQPGNTNPHAYTTFVIGEGGTGNQQDVDVLNQFTADMDAAFGMGKWNYTDHGDKTPIIVSSILEITSIMENISQIDYVELEVIDVPFQTQPTKITKFTIHFSNVPYSLEFSIKSKLKTATAEFDIIEIKSKLRPLEFAIHYDIIMFEHSIKNEVVTINIQGEMSVGFKAFGMDATVGGEDNYQIKMNINTGAPVGIGLNSIPKGFFNK